MRAKHLAATVSLVACTLSRPAAAEGISQGDVLIDLGALSLALGTFSGTMGVLSCAFAVTPATPRHVCEWTLGGAAMGFAVTAVPLLVIGATTRTSSAWNTYVERLTVHASAQGATFRWTAPLL